MAEVAERPAAAATSPLAALPPRAVLIHAGQYKSGSSSLQNALAAGSAELAVDGWLYPRASRVADDVLGHRHLPLMQEVRYGRAVGSWARLRQEIDATERRVLLSHEGFFSPELDPASIARELPGREVHVLVYLRHPVDHVESGWREWVRRWRFTGSPRDWYTQRGEWLRIDALRARWESVFGTGHVHLRPFARRCLPGGDVVRDLAQALGLRRALPQTQSNDSLNTRQTVVTWLAHRLRADAAQTAALLDLVADAEAATAALAQLDDMAAAAGFEPDHRAALARVLSGIDPKARLVADALAAEIEAVCLDLHVAELVAQGHAVDGPAFRDGQWRDQRFDAGLSDTALLRAIATLLGRA